MSATDVGVLSFAGLWIDGRIPRPASVPIVVTDANKLTQSTHDRMPVVLDNANIGPWLRARLARRM